MSFFFFNSTYLPVLLAQVLMALTFGANAQAATISGIVVREGDFARLDSVPGRPLLATSSSEVEANLRKLQDGDFLLGEGVIEGGRALLDSIDTVGLRALLGAWRSETWEIYEFADFRRLNQYVPGTSAHRLLNRPVANKRAGPEPQRRWNYALSPNAGAKWALLLGDKRDVLVGNLELRESKNDGRGRTLIIQFYHPDTLEPTAPLVLSRLTRPK